MLQERVLYYDADSVIYLSQLGQPEPRLGNYIGDLTDELGGEHIMVFASGGPKNYCYKTNSGKTEVKVRAITLDCTARQKVNFEVICALVFLYTGRMRCDGASLDGYPVQNHEKYRNERNSIEMNEERLSYCL